MRVGWGLCLAGRQGLGGLLCLRIWPGGPCLTLSLTHQSKELRELRFPAALASTEPGLTGPSPARVHLLPAR